MSSISPAPFLTSLIYRQAVASTYLAFPQARSSFFAINGQIDLWSNHNTLRISPLEICWLRDWFHLKRYARTSRANLDGHNKTIPKPSRAFENKKLSHKAQ